MHSDPDLDLGSTIDEVSGAIDPATFLRCYVGANKPLIVRGGAAHWPAVAKWGRTYLEEAAGDALVTVDVTPNGRGDAVTPIGALAGQGTTRRSIGCAGGPRQGRGPQAAASPQRQAPDAAVMHPTALAPSWSQRRAAAVLLHAPPAALQPRCLSGAVLRDQGGAPAPHTRRNRGARGAAGHRMRRRSNSSG